nr:conotoxin precursor conkunitzin [Conus judaeus]UMA83374.1 conotoxin precursor conkunitzin [Conus judaeus]UMA83696.1 conotoxin precursor conkunitzin [Conus judaeus]
MEGRRFPAVLILTICMLELGAGASIFNSVPSECGQPSEMGPCFAYFPRFYFDMASYDCQMFIYGGCFGNSNNFRTLYECYDTCWPRELR